MRVCVLGTFLFVSDGTLHVRGKRKRGRISLKDGAKYGVIDQVSQATNIPAPLNSSSLPIASSTEHSY